MKESLAGNRYAKSLIGLSIEKKELDTVYNDMVLISETVENSKDLDLLLKSPVVKTDKKTRNSFIYFWKRNFRTYKTIFIAHLFSKPRSNNR
jgi:F-type H+-transporting ATPase subunit delta